MNLTILCITVGRDYGAPFIDQMRHDAETLAAEFVLIRDGQELLGLKKDPPGMGRKALEALADMVRRRQQGQQEGAAAPAAET